MATNLRNKASSSTPPLYCYYLLNYSGIEQDTVATRVGHKIKTKVSNVF